MTSLFEGCAKEVTRLILIRHGRTHNNVESRLGIIDDTPIDMVGSEQADRTATRLLDFPISKIYSSPVLRAKQTAQIIAKKLAQKIEIHQDLIEVYLGEVSGMTLPEIKQQFPDVYHGLKNWMRDQPSGDLVRPEVPKAETWEAFESRLISFRDFILSNHHGETICAVTHLELIKGFMATFFGRTVFKPMNFLAHNASLTVIDFQKNVPILMLFNDISHLKMKLPYGKITPL